MKKFILILTCILSYSAGNAQWTTSNISESPLTSVFFTGDVGWIATNDGKFLKSTDKGCTWTSHYIFGEIPVRNRSLFFTSPDTGYFAGEGILFRTYDGGKTFIDSYPSTPYFTIWTNSIYFTDKKTGYLAGDFGIILKTIDAGNTWIESKSGVTTNLQSIYFINKDTGWVVGDHGTIRKTTDGGLTWKALNNNNFTNTFYTVHFRDANYGIMAGEDRFYLVTEDGGKTWGGGGVWAQYAAINSMKFLNDTVGYLVGDNGMLQKTIDGGKTWADEVTDTYENLNDIFIQDENHIYAVGNYGTYIRLSGCNALGISADLKRDGTKPVLSPNPASGFLDISLKNTKDMNLQVFDQTGIQKTEMRITDFETQIDLSSYSAGIYLFKFSDGNKNFSEKIVIQ